MAAYGLTPQSSHPGVALPLKGGSECRLAAFLLREAEQAAAAVESGLFRLVQLDSQVSDRLCYRSPS